MARPAHQAPDGYEWAKTAREAIELICEEERYHEIAYLEKPPISAINLPTYGTEACALADWLNETDRNYPTTARKPTSLGWWVVHPVSLHTHHGGPIKEGLYNEKDDVKKHRNNRMHREMKEVARFENPKWTFTIKA